MREKISNFDFRLKTLQNCINKFTDTHLQTNLPESLKSSIIYSYDNLQNDHDLTSVFKEGIFAARELLDMIHKKLTYDFKGTVSGDFSKFFIGLANGNFSKIDSECIKFLSQPKILKGIFMVRAIRNKLKKNVDLVFHCENFNQYQVTLNIPYTDFENLRNKIDGFDELVDIKNRELLNDGHTPNELYYIIFPKNFMQDLLDVFEYIKNKC